MAWCPHCKMDRSIRRRDFGGICQFCGGDVRRRWSWSEFEYQEYSISSHKKGCRGTSYGVLDLCTQCDTPVFAKARSKSEYDKLALYESLIKEH